MGSASLKFAQIAEIVVIVVIVVMVVMVVRVVSIEIIVTNVIRIVFQLSPQTRFTRAAVLSEAPKNGIPAGGNVNLGFRIQALQQGL